MIFHTRFRIYSLGIRGGPVNVLALVVQVDRFARCPCRSRRAARSCLSAWALFAVSTNRSADASDFNPKLHQPVQSFAYIFNSRCRVDRPGVLIQAVA